MDLPRPTVVHCHYNLLIRVCPWPKTWSNQEALGHILWNPHLWNHWIDLHHSKFYGIVCSCAFGFSRPNLKKKFYFRDVMLHWLGTKGIKSRQDVIRTMWPSAMMLSLDFYGQILKESNLRNSKTDWHGTKGMWLKRMLDHHCDFDFDTIHHFDLGFSRSIFLNAVSQEWEDRSVGNKRGVSWEDAISIMWPWAMTLTMDFQGEKYYEKKSVS